MDGLVSQTIQDDCIYSGNSVLIVNLCQNSGWVLKPTSTQHWSMFSCAAMSWLPQVLVSATSPEQARVLEHFSSLKWEQCRVGRVLKPTSTKVWLHRILCHSHSSLTALNVPPTFVNSLKHFQALLPLLFLCCYCFLSVALFSQLHLLLHQLYLATSYVLFQLHCMVYPDSFIK